MEPIGATASVLAIDDVINKLCRLIAKARSAPADWSRYYNELQTVGHISSVLNDIVETHPHIRDMVIENDEQRQGFLYDVVQGLLQDVEHAKSSLQLALCLAHLSTTSAMHQHLIAALQSIKDEMLARLPLVAGKAAVKSKASVGDVLGALATRRGSGSNLSRFSIASTSPSSLHIEGGDDIGEGLDGDSDLNANGDDQVQLPERLSKLLLVIQERFLRPQRKDWLPTCFAICLLLMGTESLQVDVYQ
ncbi:hypothetical protein B0T24DRAFT_681251 [Lasiosphaeria ovina]|uniref:Uncharacterized protein n=1 Tax=Lasiosphaeria ovina TaxID=92902 RepID=A0AAE0N370_9PEZI|nr:hypothetical protein B0T24DRAFT_681251 [Lasiosphaeria ovina]